MKKIIIIILCFSANAVLATEYVIGQKDHEFSRKKITIKLGDSLKFTNEDPFFHNIYSLSDLKMFDLGFFVKGKSKKVKFNKRGAYLIECAIHPNMQLELTVE